MYNAIAMILVTFGLPGTGKTYVGKILSKKLGWFYYDGDLLLSEEITQAVRKKAVITDTMRDKFFTALIKHVQILQKKHTNIVVSQTFIKEKYRRQFLAQFPKTKFVLVQTQESIREARLKKRKRFKIDKNYARAMCKIFEAPLLTHEIINNDKDGAEAIETQIAILMNENRSNNFHGDFPF